MNINLFWQITQLSFQRFLTYRTATLAGLITNFFFGILRASILVALYGTATNIEGASIIDRQGRKVTYQFPRGQFTASELIGRLSKQFRIREQEVREPWIEATIRRIYEDQLLNPNP